MAPPPVGGLFPCTCVAGVGSLHRSRGVQRYFRDFQWSRGRVWPIALGSIGVALWRFMCVLQGCATCCDVRWGVPCAHKVTLAAVLAMTSALVPFHHQRPCRQGSCLFPGCPLPDGFGFSCHKILLKILHFFFFCIKIFCSGRPHRCSASVSLTFLSGKRQLVLFTPR